MTMQTTLIADPHAHGDGAPSRPAGPSPSGGIGIRWRDLRQPQFLVALLILFTAALTFNAAVTFLKLHFRKEPVPLRRPIDTIPARLGPWLKLTKDQPLDKEMQDVLATDKYVFRDYVDTRRVSMQDLQKMGAFEDRTTNDMERIVSEIQSNDPSAVVRVAVTYYTGLVDTVAHIPDRCYVADGYEPTSYTTPTWHVGTAATGGGDGNLQVRYINFEDAAPDRGAVTRNVAYFFHCNGSFESDPIYGVRVRLQNLTERKGYYAKVELMNVSPPGDRMAGADVQDHDRAESARCMTDFLSYALPEVLKCLPDWKAVTATNAAN